LLLAWESGCPKLDERGSWEEKEPALMSVQVISLLLFPRALASSSGKGFVRGLYLISGHG